MKKIILVLIIFITSCGFTFLNKHDLNITRIDNLNYKQIIDKVLSLNIRNYNKIGNGYKYYAPKGVVQLNSKDYNDILKRNENIYYLYVDVIGYFYNSNVEYKIKKDVYYSNKLKYGDKQGYIEIVEDSNKLYVQMMYNNAKIETYVSEKNLNQAVLDISYILSSIDFNDSKLNKKYKNGKISSSSETYKLFKTKQKKGNFLEYIKEYDKYESKEEDNIMINNEIKTTQDKSTN